MSLPPVATAPPTAPSSDITPMASTSFSLRRFTLTPEGRMWTWVIRARGVRGSEPGELGDPLAVRAALAVRVGVRLAALEEEVQVVLPREADAAVDLERGPRDTTPGVARIRLPARGRQRRRLRLVVERPRRPVDRRAGALDLEQHLRARVRDRLVRPDRAAELLALLGVGYRHLHRPLGHADRLGGVHHHRLQASAPDVRAAWR